VGLVLGIQDLQVSRRQRFAARDDLAARLE